MFSTDNFFNSWLFQIGFILLVLNVGIGYCHGWKAHDPVQGAFLRFKYSTLGFSIFLFAMAYSLPFTQLWRHQDAKYLQDSFNSTRFQVEVGQGVDRLCEIVQWTLLTAVYWLTALIGYLRADLDHRKDMKTVADPSVSVVDSTGPEKT